MNTDLIKYITFFSLFIVCININGKIMLDENDKLVSPLPKPYDGLVYSVDDLKSFIVSTVKSNKQPIIIFGCLLYTSPSPRDNRVSRMPSSA